VQGVNTVSSLLLVNGTLVNDGRIEQQDVLVVNDRIERVGRGAVAKGTEVLDLEGRHIFPGIIDDQVHFREPGMTHKADIASESRAAIAGGVTSYLDMPNNSPPCVTLEGLAEKKAIAASTSFANYGFYLGATNTNIDELKSATPRDACGIKVFMGASTGNMLVDDDIALERIFSEVSLPVVTHCEDSPMIHAAERLAREKYGDAVPMSEHPTIRSAEACFKSSSRAVGLARRHGTRLHVLHLTTARELELFDSGPIDDKRVTCEVCVHHLWFDESDYATLGTKIKCNPSIKTRADRDGLRAALAGNRIDIVATDHAPHTLDEKSRGYFEAPAGLPLVQHSLAMLLELAADGHLTLEQVAEKAAHNPARLFGITERGFVREGYFADLAIVDLNARNTVESGDLLYKCGWSPLQGATLRSKVTMTILGGEIVMRDGRVTDRPTGRALEFGGASR
jgi:dihydroorotase